MPLPSGGTHTGDGTGDLDLFGILPNAVLVARQGRIVYANPAALRLFGVDDLSTLVEREAARAHVLAEDVPRIEQRLAAIRRGEQVSACVEYRILRPDGSVRVVEWSTIPMSYGGAPALLYAVDDVTALTEARDALAVSERHQREVVETLAEGVIVVDGFGVCSDANPSAARMLGLSSTADLVGAHADLMPLLDGVGNPLDRAGHPIWRALEHGEDVRNEVYSVVFPRRIRRVRVSCIPITDADGRGVGAVVTFDDVTEQLEAIEQVARNEERFRKLAAIAPVAVFETDASGVCTYVNESWQAMTGVDLDRALGREWTDAVHPDDRNRVRAEWQSVRASGERFKLEFRFLPPDGTEVFVHCEAAPTLDEAGGVVVWIGAATDLTAELSLRETLRDSEARFRLLVEHSPDVVVRIELNPWRIEYLSPSIVQLTGHTPEEFYSDANLLIASIHPADFDAVVSAFTAATTTEHVECRFVHVDGTVRSVEVRSNVITEAGVPKILEATLRDVSRRVAEHELLENLAHRDELTGLLNRRGVMAALDLRLASRRPTALIFLDLDGFKAINDTHGHQAGDELLREFSRRLSEMLREDDIIGRLGGDEFVAISSPKYAETIAKRILADAAGPIVIGDGLEVSVGTSIGIAHVPTGKALQQSDDVLRRADEAMYEAKRLGKGRIVTVR